MTENNENATLAEIDQFLFDKVLRSAPSFGPGKLIMYPSKSITTAFMLVRKLTRDGWEFQLDVDSDQITASFYKGTWDGNDGAEGVIVSEVIARAAYKALLEKEDELAHLNNPSIEFSIGNFHVSKRWSVPMDEGKEVYTMDIEVPGFRDFYVPTGDSVFDRMYGKFKPVPCNLTLDDLTRARDLLRSRDEETKLPTPDFGTVERVVLHNIANCEHTFKPYAGIVETYEYCTKCDFKRK